MNDATLRRAWSTLLVLLVVVSLNALSITQGWGISLSSIFDAASESRTKVQWAPGMLVLWLLFAVPFVGLTSEMLRRNAYKAPWERLPGVFSFATHIKDNFSLRLRKFSIVGSALISLYGAWHLLRKTLTAIAYCEGNTVASNWVEHFTHFVSPGFAFASGPSCRLDHPTEGVTFFPFWGPWLCLLALIWVTAAWGIALYKNARKSTGVPRKRSLPLPKRKTAQAQ